MLHPSGNAWRSVGSPDESFPAYGDVSLASFSVVCFGGTKNTSGVDFRVQRGFSCSISCTVTCALISPHLSLYKITVELTFFGFVAKKFV